MNNPIKSIRLQNFQSHQDTTVEPAPAGQLTVVTGPSDSGKTAIIRALKWALYNAPQGAEFTRTGASMVRVTMEFADLEVGKTVTVIRERTKATNRYKIVRPGVTEPEVFEGFGAGVPLEVQEITGVRTVKIADLDLLLNLSEQLDGPFLGQKSISSPGRAKILGKLAGTEEIDVAATETGRDLYRRNQDEKRLEQDIEGLAARIEEFAWIEKLGAKIAALEKIVARIKEQQARQEKLETIKARLHDVTRQETAARDTLNRWSSILPDLELIVGSIEVAVVRDKTLFRLGEKLALNHHHIQQNEIKLERLHGLEAAESVAQRTVEKITRIKQLHGKSVKLAQVAADINLCKAELKKPRVVHVKQLAAAVKGAEDAAARAGELAIFKGRLNEIAANKTRVKRILQQWETRLPDLQQKYLETLMAAGVCPLCGSTEFNITRLKEVV